MKTSVTARPMFGPNSIQGANTNCMEPATPRFLLSLCGVGAGSTGEQPLVLAGDAELEPAEVVDERGAAARGC